MQIHLGVRVRPGKYGLKVIKENYALIDNNNRWTVEQKERHRENCLKNYDLNMNFFSKLNKDEFNVELNNFISEYPQFKEVKDLSKYDGKSGYYLMVLDEYKQVYLGTSSNILKRIREHWTINKPFKSLLYPSNAVETSVLSIATFRALDTTRLYIYESNNTFTKEDEYITFFTPKFSSNRVRGNLSTIHELRSPQNLNNKFFDKKQDVLSSSKNESDGLLDKIISVILILTLFVFFTMLFLLFTYFMLHKDF